MLDRRHAPRPPGQLLGAPGPPWTRCQGGSCCASRCGHRVTHVKGQARHTSPAVNTVAEGASTKRKQRLRMFALGILLYIRLSAFAIFCALFSPFTRSCAPHCSHRFIRSARCALAKITLPLTLLSFISIILVCEASVSRHIYVYIVQNSRGYRVRYLNPKHHPLKR